MNFMSIYANIYNSTSLISKIYLKIIIGLYGTTRARLEHGGIK